LSIVPKVLKKEIGIDAAKLCQQAQKILLRLYAHNLVSLSEEYASNIFTSLIGMVGQILKASKYSSLCNI
jgi:hypothetical protein